jgi:hypothetical protein
VNAFLKYFPTSKHAADAKRALERGAPSIARLSAEREWASLNKDCETGGGERLRFACRYLRKRNGRAEGCRQVENLPRPGLRRWSSRCLSENRQPSEGMRTRG